MPPACGWPVARPRATAAAQTAAQGATARPGARRRGGRRLGGGRDAGAADRQPGRRRTSCSGRGSATGRATGRNTAPSSPAHPDWPGLAALRRAGERQMPSGQPPEAGLRLLRRPAAADRHRLAAARRGAVDQRPRGRGRGRDRPRLARLLDDRAGAQARCWRAGARSVAPPPRGAHRHAALARPDQRGRGDDAAGRRRLAAARPGPHRLPPRRRGHAVPDQHRARRAEGRPGPRLRALSLPGQEGRAGRRPRTTCWRSRARPRRSAGPRCGWSAAPTSRARRWRTATSTAPTRSRRRASAPQAPTIADSEWVAGFIALTRMDDPQKAIGHFQPLPRGGRHADQPRARRLLAGPRLRARPATRRRRRAPSGRGPGTRRASMASSPPRSWRARPTRHSPAAAAPPDWRTAPIMQSSVVQAACFLHVADDERAGLAVLPPRRRGPAAGGARGAGADGDRPRPAARSASASPRTRPPRGSSSPDQYYPLHPIAEAELAGADRVRDGDRPPGVRARTPRPPAAPGRAG